MIVVNIFSCAHASLLLRDSVFPMISRTKSLASFKIPEQNIGLKK